jgi:hypothetical protein
MKKCKSGYYYCNTDKKCKPIPRGYRVGYGGYLRKEKDDDDSKTKSNGNGNGNGNGSNGNGNGGNGSGGNGGGGNGGGMGEEITYEAKMTEKEKKKKEEIVMSMKKKKKDFEDRYGEDGKSVMYATATKLAMGEALNSKDKPTIKELIKKLKGSAKAHKQQSKDLEVAMKTEGSLHKWFKGSKSKDGKGGWVNVVTGGTCASDEPGEGTPKCVSSSKRASMSKSERLSAARRKKKADPGQQSKSGAAKPTYVSTDSPRKKKKMKEETVISEEGKSLFSTPGLDKLKKLKDYKSNADKVFKRKETDKAHYEPEGETISEVKDKKGKGSGTKDACYHKVKSRYSVWPSAYASGALVKCRKKGAANWGNSKKEEFDPTDLSFQSFMEKCWKGYEKKGMKTMFGKRYPNCVKKEETVIEHHQKDENGKVIEHDLPPRPEEEIAQDLTPSSVEEGAAWTRKAGKNKSGGLNEKGRKSYERENPGSDLKAPSKKVGNKRRASFCARMKGMKKKLTSAKTARDPDSRINKSLRAWNC